MLEESIVQSEEPNSQPPQEPKSRRISNKMPRKTSKQDPAKEVSSESENKATTPSESPSEQPASLIEENQTRPENSDAIKQEPKRNNRRRRGKGKSSPSGQNPDQSHEGKALTFNEETAEETSDRRESSNLNAQKRPHQPPKNHADPKKVATKAWKIFLAEVSEEGVALISDNDARELSRRCFRLAELFIEEQSRRN